VIEVETAMGQIAMQSARKTASDGPRSQSPKRYMPRIDTRPAATENRRCEKTSEVMRRK
jgi:hypothetical protein